jgi:hypothetical protein
MEDGRGARFLLFFVLGLVLLLVRPLQIGRGWTRTRTNRSESQNRGKVLIVWLV